MRAPPRLSGRGAGRRRRRVVSILVEGDAEVVARPVRAGRQRTGAAADGRVPAALQALAAVEPDGDGPGVAAADGEVHVEPVGPLVGPADAGGAATTAAP